MDKYLNLPAFLLLSFLIRLLFTGANIGEAVVIIALSGLYGFFWFLQDKKEPEINKDFKNRIIELEEGLTKTKEKLTSYQLGSHLKR